MNAIVRDRGSQATADQPFVSDLARLFESILAQEEEHAEDLVDLVEDLPKD